MSELESQFELESLQDANVDLTPEERVAAIKGIQFIRQRIAEDPEAVVGLTGILHAVSRSYETALFEPRVGLGVEARNDQDMLIRGLKSGLRLAVLYLTEPEEGTRLVKTTNPQEED